MCCVDCVCLCVVGGSGEGATLGAVVGILEREKTEYVSSFEVY